MRCCLHCFIDYDKVFVPVKICLKSSVYCFFSSAHLMAAGHNPTSATLAADLSILRHQSQYCTRIVASHFDSQPLNLSRKKASGRLTRSEASSECPTRFVIPAKPQRVSDRERSCRACGAVPVCSDHNLRCERYSDITVLSTLTPLESERMLLLPRIQKGLMPSSIRTML
jgi:hypothetical protein